MDTYEGKCKTKNSDSNKHIKHIYTYFEIERKKKIVFIAVNTCFCCWCNYDKNSKYILKKKKQ